MSSDPAAATESVYVIPRDVSLETVTRSLQALLPTRHHLIARHRFTMLDTFDGRVRRTGGRLTRDGVNGTSTVSWQPRGSTGQLVVRLREPFSFVWDLPAGPLHQVLSPVVGVRRLLAQADAEGYGSVLDILDERAKTVARLRIESGRARLPTPRSGWQQLPIMVTLTGLRGYEDAYARLVPVIESRPGIKSCPEGFYGVILRQVGARERGDVSSPRLDLAPTVRADVGARQIHLALLDVLVTNQPGLRANLDSEFLHDFRVAVRRTRALLTQIRHVFPPNVVEHFSAEFSWIARLTGPPRDMDVLVLTLRRHHAASPDPDIDALMSFLIRAQQQEHDSLVETLTSDRFQRLLAEWEAFLRRPASSVLEARNARRLLAEVVSQRAWRLSQRIARSARTVDEHTPEAQVHDLRIDAKKLRYLIDVTPAFYDAADLECILGALKKLQRVLGDFNDAHVHEKRLLECGRALGATGGPAGALLAVGRLAEQSRQRRERLRGKVVEEVARFRCKETRSACRRAFGERAGEARTQ